MIVNEQHRALHFAAQEVCKAMTVAEFKQLNPRAKVAFEQLAIYAGCTNVEWWPRYLAPLPFEVLP